MKRVFLTAVLLLMLTAQTQAVPTTPKDFFCILCQQFGSTIGGPLTELTETAMDISHRLYTACISLTEGYASRCRWLFKRARDSFGGISKRSAEFPQACYGVFFGCPHLVADEELEHFRQAFLENAENQDSCQRCQHLVDGIYDAMRTEELRPRLENESRLYCEKETFLSRDYCDKEASSVVDEVLKPMTNEFCQRLGFCKGEMTESVTAT